MSNWGLKTLISHSFIKISSNLWAMFMAMKNISVQHFGQLFEHNNKDPLNLEILHLASSNLHKRYIARKPSPIVILS